MSLHKYLARLKYIDSLIRKKATGNIDCLAKKINLSKPGTFKFLREMKDEGFPISYDKKEKTYYYSEEGKTITKLFDNEITKDKMREVGGGKNSSQLFSEYNYSILSDDNFTF